MTLTLILAAAMFGLPEPLPAVMPGQGGRALPRAQAGRAGQRDDLLHGPFVSSTLPTTGHQTRFKQYSESQSFNQSAASRSVGIVGGSSITPYINLLRSGNPLLNYYSYQRDQQIYDTSIQTQQINSQLRQTMESRPGRRPTRPFEQSFEIPQTPLQRRFQDQITVPAPTTSPEELALLREILRELKSIRDALPARAEQKPEEQQ